MWCHQPVSLYCTVTKLSHYNVTSLLKVIIINLVHHIANNLPHHMIIKQIFLKIIKVLDFLIANWLTAC
jgi:hypothetical protein